MATATQLIRSLREPGPSRPVRRSHPQWLSAAAIGLFLVAVAFVVRSIDINQTTELLIRGAPLGDFRDAGYFPVRATLDGVIPWDVDRYIATYPVGQEFPLLPPTYLAVHAPFQLLSLPAAALAMLVVNLVGAVALAWWCLRLSRFHPTIATTFGLASLFLVSNGARNVVFAGQATFLFMAGVYLAITSPRQRAGAVGVFIALIKPGFGIPLLILITALGRRRPAALGTTAAVAVSTVMMIPFVFSTGDIGSLLQTLTDNLAFSAESEGISLATTSARVDASATVASLFDVVPSGTAQLVITIAVLGIASIALYARRSALGQGRTTDAAVVLICLAMMAATYHSFYDLPLLLLPVLLVSRPDFAGGRIHPAIRWSLLGSLLLASFNPFRVTLIIEGAGLSPRLAEFLSAGVTGAAVVAAFVLAVRLVWRLPESGATQAS